MIRKAEAADLPRIAYLSQILQRLHAEALPAVFKPPTDSDLFCSWFSERFGDPQAWIAVAEVSGEVVGYIYAQEEEQKESWVSRSRRVFYLHHIVVEPNHENQGIGHALMTALLHEAKDRDLEHFELDVWSFNGKAQKFFERYRFEPMSLKMNRKLSDGSQL